jgi:hypothetical protein
MGKLIKSQIDKIAAEKSQHYINMVRNQYVMPRNPKHQLVTTKWMKKIVERKYWCPKRRVADNGHGIGRAESINMATPPRKVFIMEAIDEVLIPKGLSIGCHVHDCDKAPEEWLINILATVNPNHRFFEKSYLP